MSIQLTFIAKCSYDINILIRRLLRKVWGGGGVGSERPARPSVEFFKDGMGGWGSHSVSLDRLCHILFVGGPSMKLK